MVHGVGGSIRIQTRPSQGTQPGSRSRPDSLTAMSISVGKYLTLGASAIQLTAADTVTLADSGTNVGALSAATIGGLASSRIDLINITDNDWEALSSRHQQEDEGCQVEIPAKGDLFRFLYGFHHSPRRMVSWS